MRWCRDAIQCGSSPEFRAPELRASLREAWVTIAGSVGISVLPDRSLCPEGSI